MFCNASITPAAVLASQGFSNHTMNAEILFVKFPRIKQFSNDFSLLIPAAHLGDIAGVSAHREDVEISDQQVGH